MNCSAATKYLNPEKVLFIAIQQVVGRTEITSSEFMMFLQNHGLIWSLEET
jgi:hypothetical protein